MYKIINYDRDCAIISVIFDKLHADTCFDNKQFVHHFWITPSKFKYIL